MWIGQRPIDVHHARVLREQLTHPPGDRQLAFLVGSVDLGDQGREHGRPGGHLYHLHARVQPRFPGHPLDDRANPFGDIMALVAALRLVDQVHLDVRHMVAAAQVVMADHPVEVEWGGGADVQLQVGDLGHLGQRQAHVLCQCGRRFQRRVLGQVDDDLHLVLVVEREHLHRYGPGEEHRCSGEQQDRDGAEHPPHPGRVAEERTHHFVVDAIDAGPL